jgi:hypoxanthine phosphoribosyltransferase
MLYLRDFERLRNAHSRGEDAGKGRIVQTLFPEEHIVARIDELGGELAAVWSQRRDDHPASRPLLLGVGSGSRRFLDALGESVHARGCAVDLDLVSITPASTQREGRARVVRQPATPVALRQVTIVQEVLSTGLSAAFLTSWLRRHGAASVDVCALLDREVARVVDVPVVCRGFTAPDVALAGFGLARWRAFRNLPYIAEVNTD